MEYQSYHVTSRLSDICFLICILYYSNTHSIPDDIIPFSLFSFFNINVARAEQHFSVYTQYGVLFVIPISFIKISKYVIYNIKFFTFQNHDIILLFVFFFILKVPIADGVPLIEKKE